jgi:hypothetical protein
MEASISFKPSVAQFSSAQYHMPIYILVTVRIIALLNERYEYWDVGVCSDATDLQECKKKNAIRLRHGSLSAAVCYKYRCSAILRYFRYDVGYQ